MANTVVFKALRSLFHRLKHGTYSRKDGSKARIDGGTAKLTYATDLSDLERKILVNFDHISQCVPGTLEIRKQIGHLTLAGEVFYGSSIFGTISPSERHGNLRVRLSRYRRNDPAVRHMQDECQACTGMEWPPVAAVE